MSRAKWKRATAVLAVALVGTVVAACGNSAAPTQSAGEFDPSVYPDSTFKGLTGSLTWYDSSGGLTTDAKNETVWKDFTALTGLAAKEEFTDGTSTKFRAAAEAGS